MTLIERRAIHKKIKKATEPLLELVGAKEESSIYFLRSFEEVLLKTLYEVVMPIAQRTGRNEILVPCSEKKEIYEIIKAAGRLGLSIKEVEVDSLGRISVDALQKAIGKRSVAFFTSWVEGFTGAIYPIVELAKECREKDIFFFVDATEAVGKVYFRLQNLSIDLLTISQEQGTMVYADKALKGSSWGEDFSIDPYIHFSSYAKELLQKMDMHAMKYMQRKKMVEEKYSNITFLNEGANFLYDRWCFAIAGIISENLAYHLFAAGIEVSYLGLGAFLQERGDNEHALCAVSMPLNMEETDEECIEKWDTIERIGQELLRYSYV